MPTKPPREWSEMTLLPSKSEFDAIVNANYEVVIPSATRSRLGIEKGDILRVSIEKVVGAKR
jgi:hypothetical protein